VVFIAGRGRARRIEDIVRVTGLNATTYELEPITQPEGESS